MNEKLTTDQLEAIRQRAEAATEGPWECADTADGAWILDQDDMIISGTCERDQDAAFIANARQDIPALLDHIAGLERKLRKATLILDRVEDVLGNIRFGNLDAIYDDVCQFIHEGSDGDDNV